MSTPLGFSGAELRAFQLPPYGEAWPSLLFWQAEGQMAIQQVTDGYFKFILVQAALTNAQQDAVASILELDPLPPSAYELLNAELIRLHEKTSWDRMKELFVMPPLGAQCPTELLAAMKNLRPADSEL